MFNSGILMVIAGPSGAGKTTLAHHLVNAFPNTAFSVSTTTRAPRGAEVHGSDYFFVDHHTFMEKIRNSFFLEWAEVHGNHYGTDGEWVRSQLAGGNSVVLDIDVQGAVQVKKAVPSAVLVFVLPARRDTLLQRLRGRSTDSEETVLKRMDAASMEVASMGSFDYFIPNDDLAVSRDSIETIFRAEGLRMKNTGWPQPAMEYHRDFFQGLSYWRGKRVVVSSGPTREMIDDVRFVSNRSSGLMGVSLAEAFLAAGAMVTLVSGPAGVANPPGPVKLVSVGSAAEMGEALSSSLQGADLLVMAAAVSDFRPAEAFPGKISRGRDPLSLELIPTPDILASLTPDCPVVAFALEYGTGAVSSARMKMNRKGADAVFLNRGDVPGRGMESPDNAGELIFRDSSAQVSIPPGSKKFVAFGIAAALGRVFRG
jgi:guanylate kinase